MVSNAAMNTGVQVSGKCLLLTPLGIDVGEESWGPPVILCLGFCGTTELFACTKLLWLHRRLEISRGCKEEERGISVGEDGKVLVMDGGHGCPTVYLMPYHCTHEKWFK